jgi:hypothetical protein
MNTAAVTTIKADECLELTTRPVAVKYPSGASVIEMPDTILPTRESVSREMILFSEELGNVFREAGIRVPPDLVLGNDLREGIRVINDHPDKEKIEALFRDQPHLRDRFTQISSQAGMVRTSAHENRFRREYLRLKGRPTTQRALVEDEIARHRKPYYFGVGQDGVRPLLPDQLGV